MSFSTKHSFSLRDVRSFSLAQPERGLRAEEKLEEIVGFKKKSYKQRKDYPCYDSVQNDRTWEEKQGPSCKRSTRLETDHICCPKPLSEGIWKKKKKDRKGTVILYQRCAGLALCPLSYTPATQQSREGWADYFPFCLWTKGRLLILFLTCFQGIADTKTVR